MEEEADMDVKGSKLLRKFVKVCKKLVRSNARTRYCRLDRNADHSFTRSDSNRPPLQAADPSGTRSESKWRPLQAAEPSCTRSDSNQQPLQAADRSSTRSDSKRRPLQAANHSCIFSNSNQRPFQAVNPSCIFSDSNQRPFQAAHPSCICSDSNQRLSQAANLPYGGSDSNRRPLRTLSLPIPTDQFDGPDTDVNPKSSGICFDLMADRKWNIRRRLSCRLSFVQRKQGNKVFSNNISKNNCPPKDVPKGFVAVYVGDMEEEQTRFVIPVFYLNHPLFLHLLKETEQIYGFSQKGVFTIPCQVSDFEYLQWLIEREENQKSDAT